MNEKVGGGGPEEPMPDLDTLMRLVERSPDHRQIADPQSSERQLFARLADHADPMWREIGQQLRDGQMGVRRIAEVEAYWDHLQQELARQRDSFRRAVAATKAALEAAEAEQRERGRRLP